MRDHLVTYTTIQVVTFTPDTPIFFISSLAYVQKKIQIVKLQLNCSKLPIKINHMIINSIFNHIMF